MPEDSSAEAGNATGHGMQQWWVPFLNGLRSSMNLTLYAYDPCAKWCHYFQVTAPPIGDVYTVGNLPSLTFQCAIVYMMAKVETITEFQFFSYRSMFFQLYTKLPFTFTVQGLTAVHTSITCEDFKPSSVKLLKQLHEQLEVRSWNFTESWNLLFSICDVDMSI